RRRATCFSRARRSARCLPQASHRRRSSPGLKWPRCSSGITSSRRRAEPSSTPVGALHAGHPATVVARKGQAPAGFFDAPRGAAYAAAKRIPSEAALNSTDRAPRGAHVLLSFFALCAAHGAFAQGDANEAARQKFEAIARAETMVMVPMRDGV